jgi:biopolymer transport protein ExbB/TolQ
MKLNQIYQVATKSPILWGILGSATFLGLIHAGPLDTPFIRRYFTGHPVEYIETVMFGIGLAALLLKLADVIAQRQGLRESPLGPIARSTQAVAEFCRSLLERLGQLPERRQGDYFTGRLRAAVQYAQRRGSADGLDDQLKFLADADANRLHGSYSLFRLIVWAIPIMGFLGTVIGITMALNGIDRGKLDESMAHVMTGLGVKFDTTALALAMALGLMFISFFVERAETRLLEEVDRLAEEEISGRFELLPAGADGQVLAVRRMAEAVVETTERLVLRQAELWQAAMEDAAKRWAYMADAAAGLLHQGLTEALSDSLRAHAEQLAAAEDAIAERNRCHWDQVQQTQVQNVQALNELQAAVAGQADVLYRAIEASGEVTRLEETLNRNLSALAGARHFEQTVHGLAAAIHLLNSQLGETPAHATSIQLEPQRRTAHAA